MDGLKYITDKKTKQHICSYIRYRYNVNLYPHQICVFRNESSWDYDYANNYIVRKCKDCDVGYFPVTILLKEVDNWGIILSRKEKIKKIKNIGSF